MERRRALALAGGALAGTTAGCLSAFGDEPDEPGCVGPPPFEGSDPPEPPERGAVLSLTTRSLETDAPGRDAGLVVSGRVRRHVEPGRAGRIELAVVNDEPEAREFDMGPTPPVSTYRGGHDGTDAGLYVLPVDGSPVTFEDRGDDDCAAIADPEAGAEIERLELDSCGSYAREYDVFADAEGPCFEPGRYRFRGRWTERAGPLRDAEIVWTFTLSVEAV